MNDSILNSEEITDDEAMEDVTPCSSAKKKAVSRKKMFGSQDEEYDKNYSDSEDDDLSDMTSCKDGEENAEVKKKRKASTSSVDDEDNITPLKQPKTEREQKVKRKLALGQLVHNRRNHQKGILSKNVDAADSSTKESELSHSDYRSSGNESDLDGCVVEHSQSQDLFSNSDSRSSGDESDLDEFVVEDSQSQDLAEASPYFYKPTREELFVRYLEVILNSIVDEEFSSSLQNSNDHRFEKAQTYWDNLINTKKDQVVSNNWKKYKEMLMNCPVVKSDSLRKKKGKCEACLLQRTITECMMFYEEPNGKKIKEFKVGCYCADRGFLYHDLHHCKQQLTESCSEKVNEVRGTAETPEEIVHQCLEDEEWLNELFEELQSKLRTADDWGVGGKRRRAMQGYCQSF